ncbi:histamine N-methyltransferase A-like [Latimeria chalumnae]|uniref:histamine N-methyltransferase A-like n=1 Tax=Latimeria chalumnae TaxID=7897 RepID=UPI00313DFC3D
MASSIKNLATDPNRYKQAFLLFKNQTTEYQNMEDFLDGKFMEYMKSFVKGRETIKVLSIGSGTGEVDLKILKQLQALYPGIPIIYEVLEPNVEHISQFKATVPRTPNLQNVTFVWNQLTAEEYEKKMKENKECKKFDFIHMIHVLYYVNNFALTMKYFTSCLEKTGKLMIVILEATSGYCKFWHKYGGHLGLSDSYISSKQIVETLEEQGIPYQCTELENELDITDCSEETENGKLLLEFLTHVYRFSETVAPALKAEIIEYLHRSDCTTERAGKYILNGNTVVLMVDP